MENPQRLARLDADRLLQLAGGGGVLLCAHEDERKVIVQIVARRTQRERGLQLAESASRVITLELCQAEPVMHVRILRPPLRCVIAYGDRTFVCEAESARGGFGE